MTVSVNKNTLKVIFAICVLVVLFFIVSCWFEFSSTSNYLKTNGTLTSIEKYVTDGSSSNKKSTVIREKKYTYFVENQEYTCKYRTFLIPSMFSKVGNEKSIYYSPENPNKVRDEFKIETSICAGIFFAFFGAMMLVFMRKAKE